MESTMMYHNKVEKSSQVEKKTIVQEEVIEVELTPEEEETLLKLEALKTKSYILEELIDHYAWEKAGTKKKNGHIYTSYTMDDEVTGVSYVKGTGVIDFPKNVVETFLQEEKYKTSYDKVYKEGRAIEQINANAIYEHFEVNMPIFISNRDFCILKGVFERKNGKRVAVAYSVVHPKCPEKKGVVRGEIIMAGWTFEQNEAFPDKTNVNYVVQVNANGSIPKAIVNFTSSDQGYMPMRVNEAMNKYKDEL